MVKIKLNGIEIECPVWKNKRGGNQLIQINKTLYKLNEEDGYHEITIMGDVEVLRKYEYHDITSKKIN